MVTDTQLEHAGAQFLVLGELLVRGVKPTRLISIQPAMILSQATARIIARVGCK